MKNKELKCLVFGRNPISKETANGRTIASYLQDIGADNVAQIFTTSGVPDYDICRNYFYISESKMARRLLGQEYNVDGSIPSNLSASTRRRKGGLTSVLLKNQSIRAYMTILRSFIWKRRYWDTEEFWKWIEAFKPDLVFFGASEVISDYDIVEEISRKYGIPITLRLADDYFTIRRRLPLCISRYQTALRNKFDLIYQKSKFNIYISRYMQQVVESEFGSTKAKTLISSCGTNKEYQPSSKPFTHNALNILYAGNLDLNRMDTLLQVAKALKIINRRGIRTTLQVYTNTELSSYSIRNLERETNCKCNKALPMEMMYKKMDDADIILHIESFKKKWRKRLVSSLSTKSIDLMCSKRLAVIVGPEYAGVVKFFTDNSAGLTITENSEEEIANRLFDTIPDRQKIQRYIDAAQQYIASIEEIPSIAEKIKDNMFEICSMDSNI